MLNLNHVNGSCTDGGLGMPGGREGRAPSLLREEGQGTVVQSWFNDYPGLKFNPLF